MKREIKSKLPLSAHLDSFLRKAMTTRKEIEEMMKKLGINGNVAWQMDFDKSIPYQILNLGNGMIGGTHWVAVDNRKKRYFDSFGLPPPQFIPDDYEWIPLQIQNINYGHCGQFALLFLWYSMRDEIDQFYNIFEALTASNKA